MQPEDVPMDDTPLEYKPKTVSFPQISDEMVASVALGLEDELIVAARHGLSIEDYNELAAQPWFQLQVQVKRSEYEKNGVTFKAKAAWMAGELLDQVYVTAASGDASLNQKHEVLKTLIKAAGLEPKEEKIKDTGPGFSISIDLGGGQSISLSNQQGLAPVTLTPVTLDAEVKEIKNA
jgi:hypothetical protein